MSFFSNKFDKFKSNLNSTSSTINSTASNLKSMLQGLDATNSVPSLYADTVSPGGRNTGSVGGGTINEIKTQVNGNGLGMSNRFLVTLPYGGEAFTIYCESVNFPAHTIMTSDFQAEEQNKKFAYGYIDGEVTMTFMLDASHTQRILFEEWMSNIIDKENYNISYKESYAKAIDIIQLDVRNRQMTGVTLKNAYPVSLSDVMMSHGSMNEIAKFNVTFSYDSYERKSYSTTTNTSLVPSSMSPTSNRIDPMDYISKAQRFVRESDTAIGRGRTTINRINRFLP